MVLTTVQRRVIQLTPYYPPHLGGVERVAEALARGLSVDHDLEVWTTDLGARQPTSEPPDTFPVYRLPALEIGHTPVAPGLVQRLMTLSANSIVHMHVAQALWPELVALAAWRRGFKVVAHFHLDVDPTGAAGFLLPLYKNHCLVRSLRRADAVVALTQGQAEFLLETYGIASKRLSVVPNGVDRCFVDFDPPESPSLRPLRLLFVGRLDPQKNLPRLLRALAYVNESVETVIVGEGEELVRCQALCQQWGLDDVRFVGAQYGPSLVAWYKWADLFVLPSDREGMPLALLEAMASGLAVLTTNVSELADLVGDCGLVVPPNEHDLSQAITRLCRDHSLLAALQEHSRTRGHSLGWDKVVAQVNEIYESLPA